ncbi:creatininase family protein [Candidatus Ozemobacteraceae bacterium]|nr:creatininase family protein [Candidatus Ozemobacteraceae bacterium]
MAINKNLDSSREVRLERLTSPAVESLIQSDAPLFFPVGTLEAHGRHLPVGTDTLCAEGVALELARRLGGIVAPAFAYGLTNLLAQTAPASFYPESQWGDFIETTLRTFRHHGFRRLIVVNGHGGNRPPLQSLARRLVRERDTALCVINWWKLSEPAAQQVYGGLGGHAAVEETAAMVAMFPESVVESQYASATDDYQPLEGFWCYPPPGEVLIYEGNPTGRPDFCPEKARRFMDNTLNDIELRLKRWLAAISRLTGGLRPE